MHKTLPIGEGYRILKVEIAVPANAPDGEISDEISAILTENGVANPNSNILDWRYTPNGERQVHLFHEPEEGEIFLKRPLNRDILNAHADAIVIPVNTVGVAGKGLAKAAARKWHIWESAYTTVCKNQLLTVGTVVAHHFPGKPIPTLVDFPTKRHWREASTIDAVDAGLDALYDWLLRSPDVKTIAIPALGCGLGGLSWDEVAPLLVSFQTRARAIGTTTEIYPPHVNIRRGTIGSEAVWYLHRSDGATSIPYFDGDDLLQDYHDGTLEWHKASPQRRLDRSREEAPQ